ncbi:uncharacterized protein LOC134566018 [Pelobates fuscus]|uniref:uncharacterized protein LOC134566018 n=1 Tax=Pelobates fuscus TaxID=191477 RepID=UPI002FE4DC5F
MSNLQIIDGRKASMMTIIPNGVPVGAEGSKLVLRQGLAWVLFLTRTLLHCPHVHMMSPPYVLYSISDKLVSCIVLVYTILSEIHSSAQACSLRLLEYYEDFEYLQDGDIVIGGVLTVNKQARLSITNQSIVKPVLCIYPDPRDYINLLVFLFAIEHVNMNPNILPNITLGYHFYDSCFYARKAVKSVLQILSGPEKTVPNYSCMSQNKLAGFIGDHYSATTIPIADMLGVYGYAQISYGATDYSLSDRLVYPHFFRMVENDYTYCKIVTQLLKYFGWTWVGIVFTFDETGDTESQILTKYMARNVHVGEDLLTYKCGTEDRQDSKCILFHVYISVGDGIPCFEYKFVLFGKVFNITPFMILSQNGLLTGNILKSSGQGSVFNSLRRERHVFDILHNFILVFEVHIPKSMCSEKCLPGNRKVPRPGVQSCCYDCVPCSEGEITNRTDSENCEKCLSNEWPNGRKDQCIPKLEEFLSYKSDTIAVVLSSFSVLCFLMKVMILVIFIWYQDTPIVKANNKKLSFVLLVSIMLSFLCVFLFLGRPVDITCMLRQTAFGILFSIAISCILGKTIIICIVFNATQPGSVWKSFVSLKVSNCFVFCCSAVQVIINVIWLAISPPFMELDTYSHQGTIIIQCNEGSVIAFYSVLGYMGFLAAVSFIIAFLARTLPDSFNEAKYITFSMLVFCSVWIAMIPAYLSTKGKYMVAVEIFAILTSSAGFSGCIFFPKCFNIIFRPEINTKSHLYGSVKKNWGP